MNITNKPFKTINFNQAIIVRQAPLSNFDSYLKEILKMIICPKHGCNKCEWCKKIDQGKYCDLLVFDGKEMKKQEVVDLIRQYTKAGLESCNKRIYIIKNIEYASKSIVNSLLKFVEEPPVGVYAIFTTRNYNAIIPTIRSRCFSIYLPKNEESINNYLNPKHISDDVKKIIKRCFFDLKTMQDNYENFISYYDLIKQLTNKDGLDYANTTLSKFRKMDYSEINLFLEICKNLYPSIANKVIILQDNLYLNSPKSLIFNQIYDLLAQVRK